MMGGFTWFLFIYCLGGLTFLPLVLIAILLHAYFTFPTRDDADSRQDYKSISRPGDDVDAIKSAQKSLGETFHLHDNHEADVAAGYFAICREYSPGGVNGKPPERTSPVGSTTVSAPSPSVYQSMYRSLFERKTNNGPLDNKGAGKPQKKGGNVFYVVLR
jgi:DNA polymerase zeta